MTKIPSLLAAGLALPLLLSACNHDDDNGMGDKQALSYRITLTNVSNNQPLSPVAAVLHTAGYSGWQTGSAATEELEMLAEGGDTTAFVAAAEADSHVLETATGSGLIMPGAAEAVDLMAMVSDEDDIQLSLASMLVNTNDAFTGTTAHALGDLAVGESQRFYVHNYDAGTEANSETAATIPGPAGGGEGFNSARDDVDFVSIHGGVVSAHDGLATSALDESHRFNGPVAMVMVTRMQ
jgi:hypothetical protein